MKPFITVVIPAHNEEKYIGQCLSAITDQDYGQENYEVIVVDNNSSDGTKAIVERFGSVHYQFKENGPVGAVRNFGAAQAKGSTIAFLDSDCIAPKDWLSKGSALLITGRASAFGGKYEVDKDGTWIEKYWLLGNRNETSETLDLIGGTIFINRADFELVGGFDEHITSGEDSKLAKDLRSANKKVEINQALNVIHLGNAKTVSDFISRQAWHSENYLSDMSSSLKDPTFLLLLSTALTFTTSLMAFIFGNITVGLLAVLATVIMPNLLSLKRITRSRNPASCARAYHKIYALDVLYIIGRLTGIYRNLHMVLKGKG